MSTPATPVASGATEILPVAPPTTPVEEPKPPVTPAPEPAAAQPPAETPAVVEVEDDAEPDLDEQLETTGDFQRYKVLYKDHPELKGILGQHKAFTELRGDQTFSEFRQIHEMVPTLDDAERIVEASNNHRVMGESFRENPQDFIESLKESDTNAYMNLIRRLPDTLAEVDPDLWSAQATQYVNRVMSNAWAISQQAGDQQALEALQLLASKGLIRFGDTFTTQERPRNDEASRLRKQLRDRDQADAERVATDFWGNVDADVSQYVSGKINSVLSTKLSGATEQQIQRIGKEIWEKVQQRLSQQSQTTNQIDAYREGALQGKTSRADFANATGYVRRRADLVLPSVLKEVIGEWTRSVISLNQKTTEDKKSVVNTTRDVGTGPQGTTSAAAATPAQSGKRRTEEDVYRELENKTYVPPSRR